MEDNSPAKEYSKTAITFFLISGFTVLIFSSHLVVDNAMQLAEKLGVAQSFIGIVIIGLGTSLLELVVSVSAAIRKSPGMSVGNVIGSNIFDGFIPIGLSGAISTTTIDRSLLKFDLPFLLATTFLVLLFLKTKKGISKREGIILIAAFVLYLITKMAFL